MPDLNELEVTLGEMWGKLPQYFFKKVKREKKAGNLLWCYAFRHFFVLTTFWRHLWSVTEQSTLGVRGFSCAVSGLIKKWPARKASGPERHPFDMKLHVLMIKLTHWAWAACDLSKLLKVERRGHTILGDPVAVSRVGRKGGTKVFMFCPYLKTFLPPFLLIRLTVPGSLRIRTHESQRELARQSEAKRKQVPQSEANVCRGHRIMHRTPNRN